MPDPAPVELPEAGRVYGFQTKHNFDWKPGYTGRFGAFKFIGNHRGTTPVVLVYDCVFDEMPKLDQVKDLPILRSNRYRFDNDLEIKGMFNYVPEQLLEFELLGKTNVSKEEAELAENCRSFSGLPGVYVSLEFEWRWANDKAAFMADVDREQAERDARLAEQEAYYKTRLKGLTFETLLSETLFENWTPSPPFPPAEFIAEARTELRRLMEELQAMGAKPKKAAARKAIKATVERINDMDMRFGHVIETGERDDLGSVFLEIAHAAKQPKLAEEVDEWRDW